VERTRFRIQIKNVIGHSESGGYAALGGC